jgi:hypothetical protein
VTLRPGGAGSARIDVKGRNAGTQDFDLPPYGPPATMRFERSGTPFCCEATFSSPTRNDASRFLSLSD